MRKRSDKSLLMMACVQMLSKGYSENDVIEMLRQYGYTSKQREIVLEQAKLEFEKKGKAE